MSRQGRHTPRRPQRASTVGGRPGRMDFEATAERTWEVSVACTSRFSAAC